MAPEINHIYGPYEIEILFPDRIDIYSLGCMLWEMAFGKVFKQKKNKHKKYEQIDVFDYEDVQIPENVAISGMLLDVIM